jgi:hypothetical protein
VLTGLRLLLVGREGQRGIGRVCCMRADRLKFEDARHVAASCATDVVDGVYCLGDGRVYCPQPGHNG